MNCRRVEQLLYDEFEGLTSEREARVIAAHLACCPTCRELQEELLLIRRELRELAKRRPQVEARLDGAAIDRWLAERGAEHGRRQRWVPGASGPSGRVEQVRQPRRPRAEPRVYRKQTPLTRADESRFASPIHGGLFPVAGGFSLRPGRRSVAAAALLLVVAAISWLGRDGGVRPRLLTVKLAPPIAIDPARREKALGGPNRFGNSRQPGVPVEARGDPERRSAAARGGRERVRNGEYELRTAQPRTGDARTGDLAAMNHDPAEAVQQWASLPEDEWDRIETRVRLTIQVKDDFVQIPFPRLASISDRQIAQAAESYKREAAIVDPRLAHEVTCAFKATALADLCDRLRGDTGIQLSAGPSVADEKVTLFCEKLPLREVMRQLSRPFGYTWLRSKKEGGEYQYELVQDLKSQLLEEELRNRDRNAALISLEREMERYRPYLSLSPDAALARSKTAAPADKEVFEKLARYGWGPIHMYFRLSSHDLAALRAGQDLAFSTDPREGEQPLPPDLTHGVLQSLRDWRLIKNDHGYGTTKDLDDSRALPLTGVPEAGAQIRLAMPQSEVGQFTFDGGAGFFVLNQGTGPRRAPDIMLRGSTGRSAVGASPAATKPDNSAAHAALAHDPVLRERISVQPQPGCHSGFSPGVTQPGTGKESDGGPGRAESKVSTADVLEALHRATGMPIVSDYYTRLYAIGSVSTRNEPRFDTLNQLADTMCLRWNWEPLPASAGHGRSGSLGARMTEAGEAGGWLQFRSANYYHDRLKEVPNRLLRHWQAARRQRGSLDLDDLCEIAQLSDAQLDGADMAEGAKECFGLVEWELVSNGVLRPHLRFLSSFTPAQRQEAMSPAGLSFTKMPLGQQQRFIANSLFGSEPLQSLAELDGAVLRVDYTQPGWFAWQVPGPDWLRWVIPVEPGPQGRRTLLAPIRERTRAAALEAARRIEPRVRQAVVTGQRQIPAEEMLTALQKAEVVPTTLSLAIAYIPGTSNRHSLHWVDPNNNLFSNTQ